MAAQEKQGQDHPDARNEVVVSAARQSDAAITTRVSQALHDDPYIFSEHVTVTTENGILRLEGRVSDLADLHQILRLARRIAGRRRIVNEIEYAPADDDSN
jgi:osmotically-inducible protein OsmY